MPQDFNETAAKDMNADHKETPTESDSHNNLHSFLTAILICCGIYGFVAYLHICAIEKGQDRIIYIYAEQLKSLEHEKTPKKYMDEKNNKEMQTFHNEVKSLLELEFNRIQNEFEAVEIWTGILTVIFLIYSFYSLFKTEQIENQSKDELSQIREIKVAGNLYFSQFENQSKLKLASIDGKLKDIEEHISNKILEIEENSKTAALSDFDKKVESARKALVDGFLKELDSQRLTIKSEYDKRVKEIDEIISSFQENLQNKKYQEYYTDDEEDELEKKLDEEMEVDKEIEKQ